MTPRTWQELRFWSVVAVLVISAAWASHHFTGGYARPRIADLGKIPVSPPTWDGRYPCVSTKLTLKAVEPKLSTCSIPATNDADTDTVEVDLRYGQFILRQTDLFAADEIPIVFTRTYTSMEWAYPNPDHAFGRNGNHNYDIAPVGSRQPWTYQYIVFEDGEVLFFPRISPGTNFDDAAYRQTEASGLYYAAVQQWEGRGWRLTRTDGTVMHFPDSYSGTNMAQGAPFEISNANGSKLELKRDEVRDLKEIRTEHGRFVRLSYDHNHHVTRAEADNGDWREYKYNSDGLLTDVSGPAGQMRHYEYEGDQMTLLTDGQAKVLLRNTYSGSRLVAQEFTSGTYLYKYEGRTVQITKPDGTKALVNYSSKVPASMHREQSNR